MTVLAVMPGKAPERMELDGSLESMQEFVGGTIQAVYPFSDPVAIVCNDEGKLLGLGYTEPCGTMMATSTTSYAAPSSSAVWVRKISPPCQRS